MHGKAAAREVEELCKRSSPTSRAAEDLCMRIWLTSRAAEHFGKTNETSAGAVGEGSVQGCLTKAGHG